MHDCSSLSPRHLRHLAEKLEGSELALFEADVTNEPGWEPHHTMEERIEDLMEVDWTGYARAVLGRPLFAADKFYWPPVTFCIPGHGRVGQARGWAVLAPEGDSVLSLGLFDLLAIMGPDDNGLHWISPPRAAIGGQTMVVKRPEFLLG